MFSLTESYLVEGGKITAPLKGVNLIGNGPDVLRRVSMLGNDVEVSDGIWTRGKMGKACPSELAVRRLKYQYHRWWNEGMSVRPVWEARDRGQRSSRA